MTSREIAMKKIQMYSFAITEANLFLDTHPGNKKTLDYIRKMIALYNNAYAEYVECYGPLKATDVSDCAGKWEWINSPWPWMNESESGKYVEL